MRTAGIRRFSTEGTEVEAQREVDRRLCATLSAQVLTLLDAFIFPDSLDEVLPASQLHGLALVRNSEPRLGNVQGPLVASSLRLSLLLLELLEPGSVKLLQCASRMRCLLFWALELIREATSKDATELSIAEIAAPLDRLVVAVVVHSHRALGRCSAVWSEIESSSYEKYFESRESQKKHYRRLMRVALELRDVVAAAFRGRNEVIRSALSTDAYMALRVSLESAGTSPAKALSKEAVARQWLSSSWVEGFHDVEMHKDLTVPEQLSMDIIPLSSDHKNSITGFVIIEQLAKESEALIAEFDKALNRSFEDYLETQRKWAETDAVRDLENDGDSSAKRLSERYKIDSSDVAKTIILRRNGADNRWRGILRKVVEPWKNETHWRVAQHTDRLGRRTLLVQNRQFDSHKEACYEMMLGKDRERAEKLREARQLDDDLSEVMRRNVEAFSIVESYDEADARDDESSDVPTSESDASQDEAGPDIVPMDESEYDDEWDKIDTEEIKDVDADGDLDGWAKAFIWSDNESVVGRFEPVMIVSLQVYVEGKLLLTTHGLYFHQIGPELSVMTKQPTEMAENSGSDKDRRWRLTRLTEVHGRRYMLRPQALELFFSDSHELFLNFPGGNKDRDRFHAKLRNSCKVRNRSALRSCLRMIANWCAFPLKGSYVVVTEVPEPEECVS